MMTVGVIVITYNGESYICQQLDSIRKQTVKPDQVWIFDDCSTDNTEMIVSNYILKYHLHNWSLQCNNKNVGWRKNCRNALHKCNTDIVFWSDQDDIWYPDKIEIMLSVMKNNTFLIIYSNWNYIDSEGKDIFITSKKLSSKLIRINPGRKKGKIPPMLGCSICLKKQMIELLESVPTCKFDSPDWILYYLGVSLNKIGYIDKALFKRRIHESNVTISQMSIHRNWNFSYQKHYDMIHILIIQCQALDNLIKTMESRNLDSNLIYIKLERSYLYYRIKLLTKAEFNFRYFFYSIKQNTFLDCINTMIKDLWFVYSNK